MTNDLFTDAMKRLERENRRLKADKEELRLSLSNMLLAARNASHYQARKAKKMAVYLLKRTA